jgi:hypothetical protein
MYIGLSPKFDDSGTPIELTPEMVDFYNRQRSFVPTIPGTNIPVNVQPAQSQLTNMLVYLGIAAAVILLLRSK